MKHGEKVIVTSRKTEKLQSLVDQYPDRCIPKQLDLTDTDSMKKFMTYVQDLDHIDVLVNNAGYGYLAAVEEGKYYEIRKVFDTNLFGPVALTQAVLPKMRTLKKVRLSIFHLSMLFAAARAPVFTQLPRQL
nr:SDR family NAD(P)-dependent oxidoreductase [Lactobacillus sp. UBA5813]